MTNKKIKLKIISPERVVFDDEVDELIAEGTSGSFGILPDHVPFMTPISIGVTKVVKDGQEEFIATMSGTFQIADNEAIILTNSAELSEEIDTERAKAAKERAEERLLHQDEKIDVARANAAIARAMARLKAAAKIV